MAARLQQAQMCAVFVSWQQQVGELQRTRQLLAKAVQGQALRAMSNAMSAWRDAAQESRYADSLITCSFAKLMTSQSDTQAAPVAKHLDHVQGKGRRCWGDVCAAAAG
jgi:hypothetical protein